MTLQDAGASRPASDVRLQKLGEVFGRVRQLPATIANPEDIQRHARAMVVGEYLGASRGVGYLIAQSEGVFDTTGVFAAMAVLATGVLLVGNVSPGWTGVSCDGNPDRRTLGSKPSPETTGRPPPRRSSSS
jgi:hypothetical protein